jgi:hypothetical protein
VAFGGGLSPALVVAVAQKPGGVVKDRGGPHETFTNPGAG